MLIEIGLLFLAFITLAISSGFITNASVRIAGLDEYKAKTNPQLQTAHSNSVWAAVIGWISVTLILALTIGYIVYAQKKSKDINKTIFLIFFILTMIPVIAVDIFSAITAYHINASNVSNNNYSYQQSIIAAVLAIVVFVLLLIALFILIFSKAKAIKKTYFGSSEKIFGKKRAEPTGFEKYPREKSREESREEPIEIPKEKEELERPEIFEETESDDIEPERAETSPGFETAKEETERPRMEEVVEPERRERRERRITSERGETKQRRQRRPIRQREEIPEGRERSYPSYLDHREWGNFIQRQFGVRPPEWLLKAGGDIAERHVRRHYPQLLRRDY